MPYGLKRYQQTGHLHFITFSCRDRLPLLAPTHAKHIVEDQLEHLRQAHGFDLYGYVLMPEHVHLLLSEPLHHPLATTIKVLKQQTAKLLGRGESFWLPRYHDFNVRTEAKRIEKLKYIHRNPVRRGLVADPAAYRWSSFLHYATDQPLRVTITSGVPTPGAQPTTTGAHLRDSLIVAKVGLLRPARSLTLHPWASTP